MSVAHDILLRERYFCWAQNFWDSNNSRRLLQPGYRVGLLDPGFWWVMMSYS